MPFRIGPIELFFVLFFPVIFGSLSAWIASRKGLNAILGFILGALLQFIGLIIVLIIPAKR